MPPRWRKGRAKKERSLERQLDQFVTWQIKQGSRSAEDQSCLGSHFARWSRSASS
ncbi:hypothetical protein PH5382_01030 [Phaeobacter sp. CECT 5382]|nr:hypothetical protein PH5382_01030 [Phaeobacter sp. CECT 5382]